MQTAELEIEQDLGNDSPLEGAGEIFSAIDETLSGQSTDQTSQTTQTQTEQAATESTVQQDDALTQVEKTETTQAKTEEVAKEEKTEKQYPAEIKSQKARDHFDALSKVKDEAVRKASEFESKVKDLQKKVQELESRSGTASPEVKVLQSKIQELESKLESKEKIISFKAVEETEAFREKVSVPTAEAVQDMDDIAAQYSLDVMAINRLLSEPNKYKRNEMIGDLTESLPERSKVGVQSDLKDAVNKWIEADKQKSLLYENAKGNREYAEQEQQRLEAEKALARQQEFKQAQEDVVKVMREKFPEIAGDEAIWKDIHEKASKVADFDKMPAKAKMFANYASWAYLRAMDMLRNEKTDHQKTKDILAARTKTSPSISGGRGAAVKQEDEDDTDQFGGLMGQLDAALAGG